jgi:hypothetical protein
MGFLKLKCFWLLDPGGASETAARRFQNRNGRYETVSEVKQLQICNGDMQQPFPNGRKCPFGRRASTGNGHIITTVAIG